MLVYAWRLNFLFVVFLIMTTKNIYLKKELKNTFLSTVTAAFLALWQKSIFQLLMPHQCQLF
jgi:hypothetical protein